MELSALGEFGLIDLIKEATAAEQASNPSSQALQRLRIGIGDDAAAWEGSTALQLATTDSLVENVHFSFTVCSWGDLGHKSLAVNLSDIAAMGGHPLYALVALSCPGDVDSDSVLTYLRDMLSLASRHGVVIAGGNLTWSPEVCSTVTVIGEVREDAVIKRSAARPGQQIVVTGSLGASGAAVSALKSEVASHVPLPLLHALCRPSPRVKEAQILAGEGITCAIDISDGLVADLSHICIASRVSAFVHAADIPVHPSCRDITMDPLAHALWGGEDYELLFAAAPGKVELLRDAIPGPLSVIGEFIPSADTHDVTVIDSEGNPVSPTHAGWDHFGR
ncbi:MAG: thiamine-phosphate kinase [Chloroflexota bacterium]